MPVALEANQTAVVRVMVPNSVLGRGVAAAWAVEAALGFTLVASAVFVADRLARTIVRPVDALADAAGRLGEGDLSVRIRPEGPPEVKQVAEAFNRLGDRVGELLEAERELVADLSHRLRTPLTVLRLDAEGLADHEEARRMGDDIDELERAVTGVIRQARRPVQQDIMAPESDAAKVAEDRLAFWAPLAEDQERPFELVRVGPEGQNGPLRPAHEGGGGGRRARGGPRRPAGQRLRPHAGGHGLHGSRSGPCRTGGSRWPSRTPARACPPTSSSGA